MVALILGRNHPMPTPTKGAPTPYPELNQLLDELLRRSRSALGEDFVGAYLQGSFAVGGFDRHSDVDFVIVTGRELSQASVDRLRAVHSELYALELDWGQHLEGSYFPSEVLRDPARRAEQLWYLDHGSHELVRSDHDNTLVVRWILRECGVVLAGPEPASLIEPIGGFMLRREIWDVIQDWGSEILADPERIGSRFYQGFVVLSYCRMLRDLKDGAVDSKRAGAEWAKANLDPSWNDLIDRAWATRPDPARSVEEPADPADHARTLEFVRRAIQLSDEIQTEHELAGWEAYYERHEGREPSELLLDAMQRFEAEQRGGNEMHAIDLGCGAGNATLALLDSGWRVLAIDNQPGAIARVQKACDLELKPRLDARVASFQELEFPPTDLVWAGYSLPFCKPDGFDHLWANIAGSLRPGGRFAGELFGIHDSWASEPEMTFHSADQVERLLADDFQVEHLEEVEHDGDSGAGPKHWHVFHFIARKLEQ